MPQTIKQGHLSKSAAEHSLHLKLFIFHFINSYCSLFYIAFWLKDIRRLRDMLLSLLLTKQIVGNLTEMFMPIINSWISELIAYACLLAEARTTAKAEGRVSTRVAVAEPTLFFTGILVGRWVGFSPWAGRLHA